MSCGTINRTSFSEMLQNQELLLSQYQWGKANTKEIAQKNENTLNTFLIETTK